MVATIVVSDMNERLSPKNDPPTMTATINGTLVPVEWASPAAIGVRATIVPTLVPMESEMKQAAMKRPGIIMLTGRTLNVKLTVSSIHPAVLAEFAKAPAIMNIHAISMMSFAPAPMQKESILCLKALPLDTAIAYMQAVMKAIVIGIL